VKFATLALTCAACIAQARTVTDMAGRSVSIPDRVGKVACLSNNLTVYVYTLDWRKLVGWNRTPGEKARAYLDPASLSLPDLGSMPGKSMNEETILRLHPDVILTSDEDVVTDPDALQKRLGIPVIQLSVDLSRTAEVYELLGTCLGTEGRAKELASYARKVLAEASRQVARIPAARRVRLYYAEGTDGLQTDVSGSTHTQVLDFLHVENVAKVSQAKVGAMVGISFEQLLAWSPQVVLVGAGRQPGTCARMLKDPRWKSLSAVREGRVLRTPTLPFNWFDRPPSPARLLALQWLGQKLYPKEMPTDIEKTTREFYALFYRKPLSNSELQEILAFPGD